MLRPIGGGAFVRNGRLVKAVTLALVLGFSGVVGGMVQAAGVTDTTEKGGVAVMLSDDKAHATGEKAVAVGDGATASGTSAIAEGEGATASGTNAVAIGQGSTAKGNGAVAIGGATVNGEHSVAIGTGSESLYRDNVVIGHEASAQNTQSVALGKNSQALKMDTIAIGTGASAGGTASVALGRNVYVKDKYSVALGDESSAVGEAIDGTSKFTGTKVNGSNGVVSVGTKDRKYMDGEKEKSTGVINRRIVNVAGGIKDTDAVNVAQLTAVANQIKGGSGNQYLSIKPGKLKKAAKATGSSSIAIGDNAQSDSNETIVIGENAEAMKYMWTQPSTGKQFEQTSARSIAIGNNSKVVDTDAVALGYGAQALYNYSVAVGGGALADKGSAIAIGGVAKVLATDAIAIGRSVKVTAEAEDGVAIGYGAHLGYDRFDDPRIADKRYITPKTELEQLQKTPTILMAEEKYGDFSSISGDGSADDTPSVPTKKGKPIPEVTRGAVAIGHWSTASGYNAVSIGSTSRSYGMDSVALGSSSKAFLDSTVAIGDKALATKARSTAIGDMAMTEAADSIAMGTYARVTDKNSVSLGKYSSTQGTALTKDTQAAFSDEMVSKDSGVISVGTQAYTEDYKTGNVGKPDSIKTEKRNIPEMKRRIVNVAGGINDNDAVNVKQLKAVAGQLKYIDIKPSQDSDIDASAVGNGSIAIGENSSTLKSHAVAVGEHAVVSGEGGTAIGAKAKANSTRATAVGQYAEAGSYSLAAGYSALANGEHAVAVGDRAEAMKVEKNKDGKEIKKPVDYAIAIGFKARASEEGTVAMGLNSEANGEHSISIGDNTVSEYHGVAIGPSAKAHSAAGIALGTNALEHGNASIAIGQGAVAGDETDATTQSHSAASVALGNGAKAIGRFSVAIGDYGYVFSEKGIALGQETNVSKEAVGGLAIGAGSRVDSANSVAIGQNSTTYGTTLTEDREAVFSKETVKATDGVVSVGSLQNTVKRWNGDEVTIPDVKRRIVNVAGGINPNDAVNVKQLTAVAESPVYIYSGGSVSDSVYGNGTAVVPEADKNYTISNLRFAFTDGLTAGTVTDGDGNKLVKVGISDKYMQSIQAEVQKAVDSAAAAKQSETNAGNSADAAKTSETNAGQSAEAAKISETNAGQSAEAAKTSETNASQSAEAAKTSETNAGKSAKEVKDIADALKGAGIEAGKTEDGSTGSTAVGGESSIGKDSDGSVAIGKDASVGDQSSNSTAIGNGANVKDSAKEGTAIGNGSTIGDKSSGSTAIGKDANVGTDATNSTAIGNGSKVSDGAENSTAVGTGSTVGAGATNGTAIGNDTEIGEGVDNATAIGNGAKVTGGATNSVAIGAGSVADRPNTVSVGRVVEKDGKLVEETRVITHVGNGLVAKGSTDAVNGGQLYEVAQQVGNNSQAIRDLRRDSRKGDAMNAALAALKPIAYNPAEPTQIMAGIGTYRGEQAVALGAAHYVNGRTMLNAGVAYAGSSNMMANVGVTWRVGQGEVPEDKAVEADKAAAELNSRVQSLEQTVNEQREQIEKLMALLQAK